MHRLVLERFPLELHVCPRPDQGEDVFARVFGSDGGFVGEVPALPDLLDPQPPPTFGAGLALRRESRAAGHLYDLGHPSFGVGTPQGERTDTDAMLFGELLRQGLTERGIGYIVATTSSTTAQPGDAQPVQVPYAGVGKRPTPRYPHPARSLKDLALAHGADATTLVRWRARLPAADRDPDRPVGELSGHFFALRVRPAGRTVRRGPHRGDDSVLPEC